MRNLPGANCRQRSHLIKAFCFAVGFGLAAVIAIVGDPRSLLRTRPHDPVAQTAVSSIQQIPEAPAAVGGIRSSAGSDVITISEGATSLVGSTTPSKPVAQLLISRIGLEAEIVEVGLTGGEWSVPRSVVGHLAETVNAGEVGNAVFAGHVVAGGSANVFARLHDLAPGDELSFVSGTSEQRFHVINTRLVRNTDTSVLAGRGDASMVTLITCAGRWLPQENDYEQRLIVIAEA